jgi:hypothetical protein
MWKTWAQFSSMEETKRIGGRKDALNSSWKEKATWNEVGVGKQCYEWPKRSSSSHVKTSTTTTWSSELKMASGGNEEK